MDRLLGAAEEQAAPDRILPDHVHDPGSRQPADDLLPALPAVPRAEDVRPQIVEPQGVDRRIGGLRVEAARFEDAHLRPGHELFRRDVLPGLPAVRGPVDETVVGAGPDHLAVFRRRRQRVDHAALLRSGLRRAAVLAHVRGHRPGPARQVRADLLPLPPAVARLPHRIRGEVERARIGRVEQHRLGADHPVPGRAQQHRRDVLHLPGPPVPARDLPPVHHLRIERVRRGVSVLLHRRRVPLAERDRAVRPARRRRRRIRSPVVRRRRRYGKASSAVT